MIVLPVAVTIRPIGAGAFLGQALFFPEISVVESRQKRVLERLRDGLRKLLEEIDPTLLHNRAAPLSAQLEKRTLSVAPAQPGLAWSHPVELTLDVVRWGSNEAIWGAFFPALDLTVVAPSQAKADDFLVESAQEELLRRGACSSPGALLPYQTQGEVEFHCLEIGFEVANRLDQPQEDDLESLATRLLPDQMPLAFELEDPLKKLAEMLAEGRPSVLLKGPSGCGKTALFLELVRRSGPLQLGSTPFYETTGARLTAGADGFGMWQDQAKKLVEATSQQKAVVHLGHLRPLMEAGRSSSSPDGLADFLRPALLQRRFTAVCEVEPAHYEELEEKAPHLLELFQVLSLSSPDQRQAESILLKSALQWCRPGQKVELSAIERTERLHRRFATYSAFPARPLRFLRSLLEAGGESLEEKLVARAFARETGLPELLVSESVPYRPDQTRRFFEQRVLGQPVAAAMVTDAITRTRSGLTRLGRPIVSLLFVGPSGVGKTETARTLAEFLFSDRHRVVRFDLSEFSDPWAVERLTDGPEGSGLLTSEVRASPFSVVLFDELEKAHTSFLDLLLGILGEGRLTDRQGRTADFTNTVVIMTSNLGVDSFEPQAMGLRRTEVAADSHFLKVVENQLRPELFNRIDRVIPFGSLAPEVVRLLAERELQRLCQRPGLMGKSAALVASPELPQKLAEKGYEPTLGARQLKRVVKEQVVVPLARALSADPQASRHQAGGVVLTAEKRSQLVTARPGLERSSELRRDYDRLVESIPVLELENEIAHLRRLAKKVAQSRHPDAEERAWADTLPDRCALLEEIRETVQEAEQLEEQVVLAAIEGDPPPPVEKKAVRLETVFEDLLAKLYRLEFEWPDQAVVAIFSPSNALVLQLFELYEPLLTAKEHQIWSVFPQEKEPSPWRYDLEKGWVEEGVGELFLRPGLPQGKALGMVIGCHQPAAFARFEGERGLHLFENQGECLVEVSEGFLQRYHPGADVLARRSRFQASKRRLYDYERKSLEDFQLGHKSHWTRKTLPDLVAAWIEERLRAKTHGHVFG